MWYYIEDGQQRGPVMDTDLESLHRDGKINSETMIWRDGMANWQPLSQVQTGGTAEPVLSQGASSTATIGGAPRVVCSQCGGSFSASEVIRYGNAAVCATCKPIFVQKLKEGAEVAGGPITFATFGTRFAAYFVDGIITGILGAILGAAMGVAGAAMANGRDSALALAMPILTMGVGIGVRALYFIYFIGKSGQTPGKKLCKIRVVNPDGSPVGYGKATGRFFGYWLSSLILGIGFLMASWDEEKRALHDRLCNTRVIKLG
jgi:uncharacterized RDD family membrane protein YckC